MNKSTESFRKGVLNLLNKLNSFSLTDKQKYFQFIVDDQEVGIIVPQVASIIAKYECFTIKDRQVILCPTFKSPDEKTRAVEAVLCDIRDKQLIKKLKGWRNEHFNVKSRFSEPPLFTIERSAASLFGIKQYGCHVNGYVKKNGAYYLWIARRSKTKQTYPGMLDNFTGGGLTAGLEVCECASKELQEEAGLSEEMSRQVRAVDAITYANELEEGVNVEGEFVFDIKLPADFVPRNMDGEVEAFYLMDVEQVKEAIVSDDFKPNSAAITLGFLIRKGLINPDNFPHYLEVLGKLHQPGL